MTKSIAHFQLDLFPNLEIEAESKLHSTFQDNLSLPIHRWFRYSAGFSAFWANAIITREKALGRHHVLDPFAGSGTVLLEAERCQAKAIGIEAHPLIARIAQAKLHWRQDPKQFRDYARAILKLAWDSQKNALDYPTLINKCFSNENLRQLDALRQVWQNSADGTPLSELTWLALVSILRQCASVGTAQWQYVLPKKSKAKILEPFDAFDQKIIQMSHDMLRRQQQEPGFHAILHQADARDCQPIPEDWADIVITSPPYANNYDYADATRLEMTFLGEIANWGDLQDSVRQYLVRSCTQHVARIVAQTQDILNNPLLDPIRDEIIETCNQLEEQREIHAGKKPYHTMIAAYFTDMAETWGALRRVTTKGATVCFVIGDSAPYGVYVPVDRWLGALALAAGFQSFKFEKTRDRNVKWKNRKHQVPLHEGNLWVRG